MKDQDELKLQSSCIQDALKASFLTKLSLNFQILVLMHEIINMKK